MLKYLFPILMLGATTAHADTPAASNAQTFSDVQKKFCSTLDNSIKRAELNKEYKIADMYLLKSGQLFKHVAGTGKVSGLGYDYQTSSDSIDFYSAAQLTGAIDKDTVTDTKLSSEIDFLGSFTHKILDVRGQLRSEKYQIMNMPGKGVMLISGLEYKLLNMAKPESELIVAKISDGATAMDIENAKNLLTMISYHRIVAGLVCDLK